MQYFLLHYENSQMVSIRTRPIGRVMLNRELLRGTTAMFQSAPGQLAG
ncbi:hypothetical protein SFMTTN_2963 [Sulfuriferula multivorans]|uniref:Uncharacterized protein n=1 Tax=Sulfuriferula multivorans TaxID=1559896 RepID=A0A401JZZ1_9PROT|nr:hypothetical protein SFMTTN_2963 [Sulfuriferula multivorans]